MPVFSDELEEMEEMYESYFKHPEDYYGYEKLPFMEFKLNQDDVTFLKKNGIKFS